MFDRWGWWRFRSGYYAALDDIERTGLQPRDEESKERSARRTYRRITGKSVPKSWDLW